MPIKVLYNGSPGFLEIPTEIGEEFFRKFPAKFHAIQNSAVYFESVEEFQASNGIYYWGWLICEKRPFCPGFQQLKLRTLYSAPILTHNARGVDDSQQNEAWTDMVQEEATGNIYIIELDMDDNRELRTQPDLIALLEKHGYLNFQTENGILKVCEVPDECEWEIVERQDGQESVRIKHPIHRILSELLAAVDPTRLPSDACSFTQGLVSGTLSLSEIHP